MYELSRQMCRDSTVRRLTEKERLIGERGSRCSVQWKGVVIGSNGGAVWCGERAC
jgi:hypothetical protein